MMPSVFAMGFFCEDVRDEVAGTHTVIGIFPDNINLPVVPIGFPKLSLYVRIMMDPASEPDAISIWLNFPNGEAKEIQPIDTALIKQACKEAKESGAPYAGIVAKILMPQFTVIQGGRITAVLRVGGAQEQICAALNFQIVPT